MTEKKRQSTVQPEQTQGFNSPAEDELDLIDLLKFLAKKKVFILAVTSVFTLFSIFYTQSITPIYRATVGLLDHNESFSSFSVLEQLGLKLTDKVAHQTIKPFNIFERFLFNLKSHELKQEVFVNGGFQKKFSRETGIDTDQSVLATYNATKIITRDGPGSKPCNGCTDDIYTYLELEGTQPKVMLEFLTALFEAAKENVNTEINDITRSFVKTRINNLSAKVEKLHQKITVQKQIEKEKKAKEMVRLSEALDMAKRMGIKNNNFNIAVSERVPLWFLYGELLLQQKIKLLRSKEKEISKTKKLSTSEEEILAKNLSIKKRKLERLQTADLPLLKFKVAAIGKHSYSLVKPNQSRVIVGFGVAFGLFISIFMAFLIESKNLEKGRVQLADKD
jgi:LPS O-antigen subunit length determinant protein (WzzB/FepE family)